MPLRGKVASGLADLMGVSSKKAAPYIDSGRGKSGKYLSKAASRYDKAVSAGVIKTSSSAPIAAQKRAEVTRNAAIRMRQMQVGRRYLPAAAAIGGVGMYKNRDGSRGGYRPPSTRTARGSGRYA